MEIALLITCILATAFWIITKPGADRRKREWDDYVEKYLRGLEANKRKHAMRGYEEDFPADRD